MILIVVIVILLKVKMIYLLKCLDLYINLYYCLVWIRLFLWV